MMCLIYLHHERTCLGGMAALCPSQCVDRGSQTCGNHSPAKQERKGEKNVLRQHLRQHLQVHLLCTLQAVTEPYMTETNEGRVLYFLEGVPFIIVKMDKILALIYCCLQYGV